jgi:hypothetical protein
VDPPWLVDTQITHHSAGYLYRVVQEKGCCALLLPSSTTDKGNGAQFDVQNRDLVRQIRLVHWVQILGALHWSTALRKCRPLP